ncbi:MAG: response regulator transcription factor [Pseudomonadales bacterium]|nr:response regulator transcription factor [Pseudomonadales bacterium]
MRVLLVDHNPAAMENVARALRGVVELECVHSKANALDRVKRNAYDVLIACERVSDGSGLDLLGRIGKHLPDMRRVFAAAPERLKLLGPRLNPFKVAHTISYPIDLEQLWLALAAVAGGIETTIEQTIEQSIEHVVLDETGHTPVSPRASATLAGGATARKLAVECARGDENKAAAQRVIRAVPAAVKPVRAKPKFAQPATGVRRMAGSAPTTVGWAPRIESDQVDRNAAATAAAAAQAIYAEKEPTPGTGRSAVTVSLVVAAAVFTIAAVGFLLLKGSESIGAARAPATVAATNTTVRTALPATEQRPVTPNPQISALESTIETALTRDDLTSASRALKQLTTLAPQHPRLAFLTATVARAYQARRAAANAARASTESMPPEAATAVDDPTANVTEPSTTATDRVTRAETLTIQ